MKRFLHIYPLTIADIDAENRLSAGAVLCYFQDAIARFLSTAKVSALDLMEEGRTWMILEFHSSFAEDMPTWPGIVQTEVYLSEISLLKAYVDFLFRDSRGQIIARGTSKWVMMDVNERKPVPCGEVKRFVEQYDEKNHKAHERFQFLPFDASAEGDHSTQHVVTRLETDFNGHMSNRDFVRFALSSINPAMIQERTISEMHVRFVKECLEGEVVGCSSKVEGDDRIALFLSNSQKELVCQCQITWRRTTSN
jgi:medium-chain acyl-[acyl-carrier-protein] hydrolase